MAQAVFRPQVRSTLVLEVTGTSYCQTDKIVQTPNTLPSTQCTTINTSYFLRNLKSIYCATLQAITDANNANKQPQCNESTWLTY